MGKTQFTTITPLPAGVSRETVLETLRNHVEMIDLNPAHTSRERIPPPPEATPEEYHCTWYAITDKISYFPGYSGKISFNAVFHDLANGLQTHVYAPMGLDIKERWTIGGNAPGEPVQPAEIGIGAPVSGLYLREDVDIKCNFIMTKFVKKQLKDALATLVARLLVKSQIQEAVENNKRLTMSEGGSYRTGSEYSESLAPTSPRLPMSPPLSGGLDMSFPKAYGTQEQRYPPPPQQQPMSYGQQYAAQGKGLYQQGQPSEKGQQQGQFVNEIDGREKELYPTAPKPNRPVELP